MKSLELLYSGEIEQCKDKFKEYLEENVLKRTDENDNSLKKFFKNLIQRFSEEYTTVFNESNLTDIIQRFN